MKYIDADLLRKEIERLKTEELNRNSIGVITGSAFFVKADDLLAFLDTLPEQPVEGLDVTDFCKPIDPGIAQCIADHWWEMIGEESTNTKPVEGLEEEERKYMSERWKLGCTPITPVCLPNFTTDDLKECAEFFYRLGLNNKK